MRANLHLHSLHSDGTLRPAEIAASASAVGLEAAALTDHDTLGGVAEFLAACLSLDIAAWPGAEIDVADKPTRYKGEILAYFPGGEYGRTRDLLSGVAERRRERAKLWMERVPAVFFRSDLSFEGLERYKRDSLGGRPAADGYSLGKTDLFRYLKAEGVLPPLAEYREFKKAYFNTGLLPDGKYRKPELEDVAAAVLADGGVCVLPHPGHGYGDDPKAMRKDSKGFAHLLSRFRALGVRGVEMYHYRTSGSDELNSLVWSAAEKEGMFLTYGSDCHGPGSDKYTIRDFHGDFQGWPKP